jgi:hypothetical protein
MKITRHDRRLARWCLLGVATCALQVHAADHDNVQTRSECATAASAALGEYALIFDDPPQADPPRATELASEYYWRAFVVTGDNPQIPVWLHCEIIPGATATHAEVLRRAAASP